MSKIEIDGFLSKESEDGRNNYHHNYKDIFDLTKEINRFSMAFLQKLKIDWKNTHKLIIHTLCLRIIEHFQQWPLKAWQLQTTISGSGNISAFTRRGIGGV